MILIHHIEKLLVVIAQVFVLLLMLITVANIIARFFGQPIDGAVESGILMIVFILYLGLAYTQSEYGHVRVDIVINILPGKVKKILEFICLLISFLILSLMFWRTLLVGISSFQIREYLPGVISFPIWPGKLIVPFGLLFFIVRIVVQIVQSLHHDSPGATNTHP